jgi:hypothetical protein
MSTALKDYDAIGNASQNVTRQQRRNRPAATRVVSVGFNIWIDRAHTNQPMLAAYQFSPIRFTSHKPRGIGRMGMAITPDNVMDVALSGDARGVYPGKVVGGLKSGYGNPHDSERDWGLCEFECLRAVDEWEEPELRRHGLTDADFRQSDRTGTPPWVLLLRQLAERVTPAALDITNPESDLDLHARLDAHLRSVIAEEPGTLAAQCAETMLDVSAGARRWKENFFRDLSEEATQGGRKNVTGHEARWRRQINRDLPGSLELGGLLPGDPEYRQQGGGAFTAEDRALFRQLVESVATQKAATLPQDFQAAVQAAVDAAVKQQLDAMLAAGEIEPADDLFSNDPPAAPVAETIAVTETAAQTRKRKREEGV